MEPEQIKLEIERCFVKALSLYPEKPLQWKLHPVRVVQAAKSIVGMDLESPSKRLMDWLGNYCDSLDQQQMQMPEKKQVAHLALEDLKTSLMQKDRDASMKFLSDILAYSDGRHILEFLLEISLMQRGESTLFVWSAIRMNLFLSKKFTDRLLLLCGASILACDLYDPIRCKDNGDSTFVGRSWRSFEEGIILDEIGKENLVRESSIKMNMDIFVNSCMPMEKTKLDRSSSKMWNHVSDERRWISSFIESDCDLNPQNILLLDAARALHKNNPDIDKDQLLLHLDRSMVEAAC